MTTRINYGVMPTAMAWDNRWSMEMESKELYPITHPTVCSNRSYPREHNYTCKELYDECVRLIKVDTEESLSWVSDILSTLGFEWI